MPEQSDHSHPYLNPRVTGLGISATLAINETCKRLEETGSEVYRLGLGQSPFPIPEHIAQALRDNAHRKDYLPAQGLPALREEVAGFHQRHDDIAASADNVLIGPGSKELLFLLQMVFKGDLLVPSPCWVSYAPQADIVGKQVRLINTDFKSKWRISARQLDNMLNNDHVHGQPKLLILNYPGNPDGGSYSAQALRAIARVARKHGIFILSDEIYARLHHKDKHVSIAKYYPEGTIVSSGLSKWCGAGGWRLGTFTFPDELSWLRVAMTAVASETYSSVNAPTQHAAVTAFRMNESTDKYLFHVRRSLAAIGKNSTYILRRAGIQIHDPVGGFYLFPSFENYRDQLAHKGIMDSKTLCERLLQETGVAVLPGVAFMRPPEELTARLAYVNFNGHEVLMGSCGHDGDLMPDFARIFCKPTITAMERIAEWTKNLKK